MDLIPKIQLAMESAHKTHMRFVYPLKADVKIGPNWGELKDETNIKQEDDAMHEMYEEDMSDL